MLEEEIIVSNAHDHVGGLGIKFSCFLERFFLPFLVNYISADSFLLATSAHLFYSLGPVLSS